MTDYRRVTLGEVLTLTDRSERVELDTMYPQLGVRLWGEGPYERNTIAGRETKYETLSRVERDDIVVNKIWARHGSIAVIPDTLSGCYVSSEFPIFSPDLSRVDPKWFDWLTKTRYLWDKCSEKSHGTSGKNRIRPSEFLAIEIALPSFDQQVRIRNRLEIARLAIGEIKGGKEEAAKRLRNSILQEAVTGGLHTQSPNDESVDVLLQELDVYKERYFKEMKVRKKNLPPISNEEIPYQVPEGWSWVRLGELATKIGSGSTPLGGRNVYTESGIPFIRSQNVWNQGLKLDDIVHIPSEIHEKMKGTKVNPGDILLNITGASIGRTCLVPEGFKEGNVSQHVSIIRMVFPSMVEYVHYVLQSPYFQNRIQDVQVGVSREGLSKKNMELLLIPFPPRSEQHRIVGKLKRLLQLCDILEERIQSDNEKSSRLMQTILKEAFGPSEIQSENSLIA